MDPLTAIGLASNILSFIDYGIKIVSIAKEILSSAGSAEETRSTEVLVENLKHVSSRLQPPPGTQVNDDDRALCKLAAECGDLSDKILRLIKKMKPKDAKSKSSSLTAAVKTKWYEGDLRKLEVQLGHCRAQLSLQLDYLTSVENKAKLDSLLASAKDNSSKLEHLYNQSNTLQREVTVSSLSPEAQKQISTLLDINEHASNAIVQSRIIKSLAFDDMYGRYETVDYAHFDTFRWVFEETTESRASGSESDQQLAPRAQDGGSDTTARHPVASQEPDDQVHDDESVIEVDNYSSISSLMYPSDDLAKKAAREVLVAWLSRDSGIFHISGKLGSGKSTLMKFLCARNLVFAKFFFWRPGSKLQKSLKGLFRSLLHDVLKAYPDVIPDVLSEHWRSLKSTPWHAMVDIHIPDKDIQSAFSRVIADPRLYKNHCFCFFIDGLDEYEGTHQEDARVLVDVLCKWTTIAPGNTKICVASREHNLFMNVFSPEKRIRLHELTREDMTKYVADKLGHMESKEDRSVLISSIVSSAGGIFLWVALVVRRLREQMENGSSFDDLQAEVNELPRELDALFELILNSLIDVNPKRTYQAFALLMAVQKHAGPLVLTLYQYSFLDDYNRDPTFATKLDPQLDQITTDERSRRIESARKRVIGCCGGLVDIGSIRSQWVKSSPILYFSHRSVPEFLEIRMQKNSPIALLEESNPVEAMSQLALAEGATNFMCERNYVFDTIIRWRTASGLDRAPYLFLESMSKIASRGKEVFQVISDGDKNEDTSPRYVWIDAAPIATFCGLESIRRAKADGPSDPIYAAAYYGNWEYVRWKLMRSTDAACPFSKELLLFCLVLGENPRDIIDTRKEIWDHANFLIQQGLVPDAITNISYLSIHEIRGDRQSPQEKKAPPFLTIWQQLLFQAYLIACGLGSGIRISHVLERYLIDSVDLQTFRFLANRVSKVSGKYRSEWHFTIIWGQEEQTVSFQIWGVGMQLEKMEAVSIEDFLGQLNIVGKERLIGLIKAARERKGKRDQDKLAADGGNDGEDNRASSVRDDARGIEKDGAQNFIARGLRDIWKVLKIA